MNLHALIKKYDKDDYLKFLTGFPEQIKRAMEIEIPAGIKPGSEIRNIALIGMGGSAIGGDILRTVYEDRLTVPFSVIRNYQLPAAVDSRSLVFASSYSGNTEETLSAFAEAVKKNAYIICITTGGELQRLAEKFNYPVIRLPEGYQPRAAVGYSFIPLLRVIFELGLIPAADISVEINESIEVLTKLNNVYSPDSKTTPFPMELAQLLQDKIPLIYSPPSPFESLGKRWSGQLSEIAKVLSYNGILPEMNHNEVMGWDEDFLKKHDFYAVFLRDKFENERVKKRMEITFEIVKKNSGNAVEVWSNGNGVLARILSLLYLGDYTSYYLALLNRKDPTVIGNIKFLKEKLAEI